MLLVGSRAARYHYPDFRKPRDYDFIATYAATETFLSNFPHVDTSNPKHSAKRRARVELHGQQVNFYFDIVERCPSSELIHQQEQDHWIFDKLLGIQCYVASPATLYLLKRSHITFNIHWDKSIHDFLWLKRRIDPTTFPSWWNEAFFLRYHEVKARIAKKQLDFNISNSEFFRKSERFVNRIVEHDSLHYATCFGDKPLFLSAK